MYGRGGFKKYEYMKATRLTRQPYEIISKLVGGK